MRSRSVWRVLLLVAALALVVTAMPLGAAGANGPVNGTYPLYAGQDILVGELTVTNDTQYLYVTFDMTGDYCMTETHLQVGDLEAVQTKNGNPIPGQFEYSMDHDCVYTYTYQQIALDGLTAGDPVDIAAHASVKAPIDGCSDEQWIIGEKETMELYPSGPYAGMTLYTNYADEFNWEAPADDYTAGPGLVASAPAFADPFIIDTNDDAEFPYNSNFNRGYATDFDVQWDGHLHFGGTLTVSWSPGQSAAEMKAISPGATPATFSQTGVPAPGQGFFLNTYPVFEDQASLAPLGTDTHTINFQHTKGDGTFWDWVTLERPCETEETAWSAATDFPGKNWATYSIYTVESVVWLCHFDDNHTASQPYGDDRNGATEGFFTTVKTSPPTNLVGDYIVAYQSELFTGIPVGLNPGQVALCEGNGGEFIYASPSSLMTIHGAQLVELNLGSYPTGTWWD